MAQDAQHKRQRDPCSTRGGLLTARTSAMSRAMPDP